MWSPRRLARISAGLLMAAALGGCGFHPLYGQQGYDPKLMHELATVHVNPLQDRHGQLIHNALLTDLNPRGEPEHPRYTLTVLMTTTESQQALTTFNTATRDVLTYRVKYILNEAGSNATLASGTFIQTYSYDFLEEHYANISALEDVRRRSAQAIADEIRNGVATYFAKAAQVKADGENQSKE